MTRTNFSIVFFFLIFNLGLTAQKSQIDRVDPAFWWTGMANDEVELMVYHPEIADFKASLNYTGVSIKKQEALTSKNYLFLLLKISKETKAGKFNITFENGKKKLNYSYELKERVKSNLRVQGIDGSDFIYLIMPDRFSNGDPSNDVVKGMNQTSLNRDSMFYRHGGDLQGIINKLDYLKDLGVTALWLNPVQENDEPKESYHGYAITDHYKIDRRLGNNALYLELVNKAHEKGIKIVMDIVPNHVGDKHHIFLDKPSDNWFNLFDKYTKTTYRAPTLLDPYRSEHDLQLFTDGWFDRHMPDLNQRNEKVASFLTQSYIWWVEYTGIDGFRIDTYAYPDQSYMSDMAKKILQEYPNIGMFAEIWDHGVPAQAFFTENYKSRGRFNSFLPSAVDFQLHYAINKALTEPFGWTEGVSRIYYTLAFDHLYNDPFKLVTFLDNHDLSRFYSVVGENLDKFKIGVGMMMTLRGIPSLYYGTEILMKNFADPDGKVREDFPGGWKDDKVDKFVEAGRTDSEKDAFNYIKRLAQWRKKSPVLHDGKLMQFVPEKGIYVYFRYNKENTVMVVVNTNEDTVMLNTERFIERTKGFSKGFDWANNFEILLGKEMKLNALEIKILELKK
jgi:glycosidase